MVVGAAAASGRQQVMRLVDRLSNAPADLRAAAITILMALPAVGCSTYTLAPITAKEAGSDFPAGTTFTICHPKSI
jgi:hypothetical protein